jgi:tRNA U34 2-thiouridine synthase MnmA/TrmU
VLVKVRARHEGARARVDVGPGGEAEVTFLEPVGGVSPGQYAVAYAGEVVVGGGRIVKALPGGAEVEIVEDGKGQALPGAAEVRS